LARFAPPLPITLPTALAGTTISNVDRGGKLCLIKGTETYELKMPNQLNIRLRKETEKEKGPTQL
jgi:hypothetical protein